MTESNPDGDGRGRVNSIDEWDVAVVGAGPSGATCALVLARRGHRVLLLDKERFPRDKACGDLLIPDAISVMKRLGTYERIRAEAFESGAVTVCSPSGIKFDVPSEYLTLKRFSLDKLLVDLAVEAGAIFGRAHVTEVESGDSGVEISTSSNRPEPVRAKFGVLATGGVVDLAMRLGIVIRREPSAVAIRGYVKSQSGPDQMVISYDRSLVPGYGWIIPLGNDEYNVGCGITQGMSADGHHHLKKMLDTFITMFPPAVELMRTGEWISKINGASLRCSLEGTAGVVRGRIVGVGETIGTTFPFTGEGIGKAMHSGELAALAIGEAIERGDTAALNSYQKRLDEEIKPLYRGYEVAQKWLSKPWLNDFMARRFVKSRYLQRCLREFMEETGDPRRLYSPLGIMRSYFE